MAYLAIAFLIFWAWTFISQVRFMRVVAPAALTKWAQGHGFEVEQRSTPIILRGPFMWTAGPFRLVYRVTVRDRDWRRRRGWVRLGRTLWPSSTVDDCPVEAHFEHA